jgi:Ion channel
MGEDEREDGQKDERPILGARRGMPLRERFRAPDSYGLVLILILLSLLITAVAGDHQWGRAIVVAVQGGALLYAQWTARIAPRLVRFTAALVVLGILLSALTTLSTNLGFLRVTAIVLVTLGVLTILVIGARLIRHPEVSGATLLGAVCIYLLIGFTYAYTYGLVAAFQSKPFFAQGDLFTSVNSLYFSFVTLATVGYGDLTARGDVGKMLAVSEGLLGQLYLVTVVALAVSNIGRRTRRRG